jgi:hypothetical protein
LQLLEEVSRSKELYQRRLAKLVQNRIKYENMWKKGKLHVSRLLEGMRTPNLIPRKMYFTE